MGWGGVGWGGVGWGGVGRYMLQLTLNIINKYYLLLFIRCVFNQICVFTKVNDADYR